jgi:tetratricopeptide (TPR) repeat protein
MRASMTLTFLFAVLIQLSFGQDYRKQFNELVEKKDTVGQKDLLDKWKSARPDDSELYTALFNYYVQQSRTEVMRIGDEPKGEESLAILDKDTTKEGPVGYLYSEIYFEPQILNLGLAYIDSGISRFPTRLDMRFGKIYMLGQTKQYDDFANEIVKTINFYATSGATWTWTNDEPVKEDSKGFMLSSVQDYVVQLFNAEDNGQAGNIRKISDEVLKFYPNNVEYLSNKSISYILEGDFDGALMPLLKAEKLAPTDHIVLGNIAHCYVKKNDTRNAIKYYEKITKCGDEQSRNAAQQHLKVLRKRQ